MKLVIFTTHEMKYFWYLPKKVNFLFIFSIKETILTLFIVILVNFVWLSAFSRYNIG